jgi:hypothetical protein
VLEAVKVLPSATVRVEPVAGAVMVTLLTLVAEATPREGVVSEGDVAKTKAPEPVSSVTAAARFALVGVARKVATPVPRPEIPVLTGRPVQFVSVPDVGVPKTGLISVGVLANTRAPVPVSSVTAKARLELVGVARKVATPVPSPEIPLETGRPVQFVSVPEDGVPRIGVTSVGEVERTTSPVPVTVVIEVPLILKLFPVPAVSNVLLVKVSVVALPTKVSVAAGRVNVPDAVADAASAVVPDVDPLKLAPAVPMVGVVKDGDPAKTKAPVPVSSLMTPANSEDVVAEKKESLFVLSATVPD